MQELTSSIFSMEQDVCPLEGEGSRGYRHTGRRGTCNHHRTEIVRAMEVLIMSFYEDTNQIVERPC
jgi:hypothetical protein